ncbi:ankyrin-3-like isoform X1 [Amphibalanus amphitrite]|uniref:ankyrin-3-like isoform X1 n=2 Tax=Amphibalanus amphitrite TaxID=1232801 RepID=UPI001C9083E5|nr:ankyrin-3-like isoform X1 [Amphibalanus amphitrite]
MIGAEAPAMRARQETPSPPQQQPAMAPAPLPVISFDVHAFLGDDPPVDQLLQSLLDSPRASVPAALPPPAPAAAAGCSAVTTVGAQGRPSAAERALLARVRRVLEDVKVPAGVPPTAARMVLVHYMEAQRRSTVDGNILLHKLAKKNNAAQLARYADLMKKLQHKTHVNTKNRHGETPLHVVTGAECARILLERGAQLDAVDKLGNTPIHLAARYQRVEVLAALLDWGPDYSLLDKKNLEGYTALHLVVIHQPVSDPHRRALQLLIENSVDVNVADDTGGRSALFHAVLRGDELSVRELVENNAAVNMADFSETTPLQAAEDVLPANNNHICSILLERGGFKVPPADRVTQTGRRSGSRRGRS